MSDIIQLLPDHVANQIAAGEVVQRPASVVKELLENAVDAGATQINLVVKDAGKSLIQVVDDGLGMSMTDTRLAFERHATSKIKSAEDLFNLHTKGFRGEALASIAAVAQVQVKSKTEKADVGTSLQIEASRVKEQQACVTPKGTSIAVKNLFYNIPARRNFLKSDAVEQRHIIDEFQRVALAHPKVGFSYVHNSSELFHLKSANFRQRIVGILGAKTNEKLVPVEEQTDYIHLKGFIIKPEFAKKTRGEQFFFVNNRFIKSSYLHHAVNAAYEGLMRDKSIPSYFLYIDVDPKTVDINIHPTKTEIKFEDEHSIYAVMRSAIKHSLGQFQITPALDFDRDTDFDTSYEQHKKPISNPTIQVNRDYNPFEVETPRKATSNFSNHKPIIPNAWESLYTDIQPQKDKVEHSSKFLNAPLENNLFQHEAISESIKCFQFNGKFIVADINDKLLVIDQHRAHSRILYEDLMKSITLDAAPCQQLLFPLEMEFSSADFQILTDVQEALVLIGFSFEKWEDNETLISGIPSHVKESDIAAMFDQLVADMRSGIPKNNFEQNDILAKSLAKNMAIKSGRILSTEEQHDLIHQLFTCKEPTKTATNQNIFINFAHQDLEHKLL